MDRQKLFALFFALLMMTSMVAYAATEVIIRRAKNSANSFCRFIPDVAGSLL
jgi:hypothetical protein